VKRADAASAAEGKEKTAEGKSVSHKFVIDRLAIRGAKVTMTNPGLKGQGLTFDLPDIELRDLGKSKGGLTASEVANAVTSTLISRIAQRVLTNIDLLKKGGVEGAIDAVKGLFK
jgi:nitrous oxidase accessory protein NosD